MDSTTNNFLIAAGGTGGHLFPAMAVVEQLTELNSGNSDFHFVGNKEKIEGRIVPEAGYKFHELPISGFYGIFDLRSWTLPLKIIKSTGICKKIIKKNNIKAVICAGAYLSYPAGAAASKLGVPLILMESNVYPGKTIRLLASRADAIIIAFEETRKYLPQEVSGKIITLGNPVRNQFDNAPTQAEARKSFGLDPAKTTILIFGGSLGAVAINKATEAMIDNFGDDVQFIWQTGKNYTPKNQEYKNTKVLTFIDDMASAYSAADLVVCRSGATTVAELTIVAKPSILVPLSSASNNEQESNAIVLERKEAAVMLYDEELQGGGLEGTCKNLLEDESILKEMSKAASELAKPQAALDAAQKVMEYVG